MPAHPHTHVIGYTLAHAHTQASVLQNGSPASIQLAAATLAAIAVEPTNRDAIVNAKAVPALVKALHSLEIGTPEAAARALTALATADKQGSMAAALQQPLEPEASCFRQRFLGNDGRAETEVDSTHCATSLHDVPLSAKPTSSAREGFIISISLSDGTEPGSVEPAVDARVVGDRARRACIYSAVFS